MISTYWLSCREAFIVAACTCSFVDFCRFVTRYSSCSVCIIYLAYFKSDAVLAGLPAIVLIYCDDHSSVSSYSPARVSIWVKTLEVNSLKYCLQWQSLQVSGQSKKLLVDLNYNKPVAKALTSLVIPVQLVKVRISRTWTIIVNLLQTLQNSVMLATRSQQSVGPTWWTLL